MSVRFLLSGIALVGLTACGGGGGGGGGGIDLNSGDGSFSDLTAELPRLSSYFSSTPTSNGNLPAANTVNYDGVMLYGADLTSAGTGYLGQVDIDVDFSTGSRSIDGTASNFFLTNLDSTGDPTTSVRTASGSLTLSGGNFTTNDISFDVDGTVDGDVVDGTMDGRFARTASNSGPVAIIATEQSFSVDGSGGFDAVLAAD